MLSSQQALGNEQLEEFRRSVDNELVATNALLADDGGNSMELDQTRVGRLSRIDAFQQQAMASGMRERLQLRKRRLEAARARLDAGEFGLCCQCGEAMVIERLQADPGAPFCAGCQEEIDERRGSS